MELLPASLSFFSSAPLCLHFPCIAWLIICSSEACDGLQLPPEFSPLIKKIKTIYIAKIHLKSETVTYRTSKIYLCIVFLKDEKESLGLFTEE